MNGTGTVLGLLAGLSAAGIACSARGSRAWPSSGNAVDAATVRAAMYRSSQKHAGTGRDARLAERQVPDFDQLTWTLEDVRPGDDRLCQVSGCNERDVAAYVRRMAKGEVPPPVVLVARDGDNGFECVDGSHRVEAAQRAELDTIPAYVGRPARRGRKASEILVGQDGTPGGGHDREATWVPLQAHVARKAKKGSRARASSDQPAHDFLPLATIDHHVPAMQRLGVSEVARSPRGFLAAYRAAGGDATALSPAWRSRREGFIARHVAQVRERNEPLVDPRGNPTRRHLALIAWAYSPFPEVAGSLAREPYANYGRMGQRELENFRVLLQDGVKRRRATISRYQDEAAKDADPLGRRVRLDLAERQRGPLAWHEEELAHLEAQQRRRGSRAKPMVLSSRGWVPSTPTLPPLPSTTLRWDRLPDDVRSDGFLLASIHDGGLRRPQGSTVLAVSIRPLDDAWRLFRAVFPGRDIGGNPAAPDAEDHWDERGPAHVVTLVNLLEAVFPDPAKATPEEVLQKWMLEDRTVTYAEPEVDADFDDIPPGHSTLASTVQRIGPPHAGMLLPPLVVDADGFVDGRHRIYAARLAGLRYVPVLDLSQLEKR